MTDQLSSGASQRDAQTGARRVFVIGLDCAEPSLIFERWQSELPNLCRAMSQGVYGRLRSAEPPITVPAWSSMLSGKDPGQLGIYGFRNRADYSYDKMSIATGSAIKADRVWDILGRAGKQCIVMSVPQTYPVRPLNGHLVSCFLTPPQAEQYTWPRSLKGELEGFLGEAYTHDIVGFRTEDKNWLLRQIYQMSEQHFRAVHYMMDHKPWDFFMFVEMGVDRIHHGFWSNMDPTHPHYVPGNPFENAIHDYYVWLDGQIGQVMANLAEDTVLLVVSDHGARAMLGGFCVNEWLIREGLLTLKRPPAAPAPVEKCEVDWSQTRVWGSGGYYARIFFNVEGREPQGVIPAAEYEAFRAEMVRRLEATTDANGKPLGTVVSIPTQIYRQAENVAPDLIVYFGNLAWRSVGSIGLNTLHTLENDTGPDDANHDWEGIFIATDPRQAGGGKQLRGLQLQAIAPTILQLMGVPIPTDMASRPIPVA